MKGTDRFFAYFSRRPGVFAAGVGTLFLSTALFLTIPGLVRRAFEDLERTGVTVDTLFRASGFIVLLAAGDAISFYFTRKILIGASRDIEYEMRQDLFAHLLRLPPPWFRKNRVGDLMSRAVNDLSAVRMMIGPGVMQMANTIVVGTVAIFLMFRVSTPLTLVALSVFPAIALATNVMGQITHKRFTEIQEFFSEISNSAQENFSGVRLVRAFAKEGTEERRFAERNREFLRRNLALARLNSLYFPLLQFFVGAGFALVLYVAGRQILSGKLTIARFVEFNLYMLELIWPAIALGWVVNLWQRGTASWNRMMELWDVPPLPEEKDAPISLSPSLEVRGLSFGYVPERQILSGATFRVAPGEVVALVGKTGSGKSTILSLILRLDDPPPGAIQLGGIDVLDIPLPTLRRLVSVVPQETFLFSETLAGNIAFGRPDASAGEIEAAALAAGLGPDLERFPDGLATRVGERGITLSGGQKQRTALARALISDAPVLLLDDSFASVDTETEARILSGLREAAFGKTVLLVSHRMSTLRNADRIVVLDGGRIAESGTHEELLARGGVYSELAERQRIEEEVEAA
ncbi:MAG: putative multidrug resistance ABC transporter ATP-binding/permease protein YheI [Thermoanaerobaculia bacterium]|nr:putative multidrug resistance ABC transporter ATP-binding/permease protein YheI [Thermoanaerobaculia bacterium]